jgi:hypothetical protein
MRMRLVAGQALYKAAAGRVECRQDPRSDITAMSCDVSGAWAML